MNVGYESILEGIYAKDPTLWKADSEEHQAIIRSSLGWVDLVERMRPHLDDLRSFGEDIRDRFDSVVLLGMGGSSLCPEVYKRTFGRTEGWPELIVLDSVVPEAVREVEKTIDLEHTVFILASKSGSTIEPMSLYKRFRGRLEEQGRSYGEHFVAITDPGSPLDEMARKQRFRRTFLNFDDIGGRYSALSFFGMVPAAMAGYDVHMLLERADRAFRACSPSVAPEANPAWLLGSMAGRATLDGADKLTLVMTEALSSVGLWIEQLVAESTGKEGTGVVPIAGEPVLATNSYGDDRTFVVTRLENDDPSWAEALGGSHPLLQLQVTDAYDVAWLFVVWEIATSVMGAYLEIDPFDQPNVEDAKIQAKRALAEATETEFGSIEQARSLIEGLSAGDYLGLLIYGNETESRNETIADLRKMIAEQKKVATTAGYGPRYLHSTGQLHKGGPDEGAFIILTLEDESELPVHGEPYSLNRLAQAQATGDRRALEAAGRRVVHLHGPSIDEILAQLKQR
ncbi:MAG: glucose-6-phosphate isomerase [Acidobacteria bacterium]|nr:glucose-6-phosphate isomerase [Acidobacteriota bacterium]